MRFSQIGHFSRSITNILIRKYAAVAEAASPVASEQLLLTLASPDKAFFRNEPVKQVDVPTMTGNVGILPKHVPVLGVLKPGVLKVHKDDGGTFNLFVSSGTLSMNIDGTCQVLAEEVCPLEDIDIEAVRKEMDEAQRLLASGANEMEKAEASIAIEVCEALSKAV